MVSQSRITKLLRSLGRPLLAFGFMSVALANAGPASAQLRSQGPGRIDLSAGYSTLSDDSASPRLDGWNAQVSIGLSRRWWFVGELDRHRYTKPVPYLLSVGLDGLTWVGLGGVRSQWQKTDRLSMFWQLSAGVEHEPRNWVQTDANENVLAYGSRTALVVEAGLGLTFMATSRLGFGPQAALRSCCDDPGEVTPRVALNAVIKLR